MAKSIYSSDIEVTVAAIDEHSPRATICAPLMQNDQSLSVLYLDVPIGSPWEASAEELLALVCALTPRVSSHLARLSGLDQIVRRQGLDQELALAHAIQLRFAPTTEENLGRVSVGLVYKPVLWVGGDYCDIWSLDDGRVAFVMAEIRTTGIAAALLMPELRAVVRTSMRFDPHPAKVLEQVRSYIEQDEKKMAVGITAGVLDADSQQLELVVADGPVGILEHGGKIRFLGEGRSGGPEEDAVRAEVLSRPLSPGDRFVVCSDGAVNAKGRDGAAFGLNGVAHVIMSYGTRPVRKLPHAIHEAINMHTQAMAPQADVTILAVEMTPGALVKQT